MKIIQAGKFKAQCLALLDEVAQSHNPIVVTKHGKPVAKIVPVEDQTDNEKKPLRGSVVYMGDVISKIDEKWEAAEN